MADSLELDLFGDQTYEVYPHLRALIHSRRNVVLQEFVRKAYNAICTELERLPRYMQDELPRYTCLDDLLVQEPSKKRCLPLDMALTSLYHLALYIRLVAFLPHDLYKD